MDQCYADGGINPSAIPGANLDPDAVVQAASDLRTGGGSVRDEGAATVAEWRKIGPSYEAPEASTLLTVMDPVETTARDFGDAVERVADALDTYAETTRAIKAALDSVRTDAYAFRRKIAGDPEWQYDQDLVDENTALVRRVNTQQTALWEAERTCANAIRALYCAAPWVVDDGSGSPMAYGAAEIPTDAETPWGGEVSRKDHCPKSAAVGVKRFVWDGFVVDGLWGTVQGLGMLVGIDGNGWSWETMRTSWVGMGSLIGYADGEWSWGNAGEAWKGLGKGLIAYDTWSEDPARAAGGVGFNLLTIVVPAGAAVSGTKGAATAAGTSGRVANAFAKGAKVADMVDPVALGINGARAALPKLGDMATGLRLSVDGMIDEIRTPEIARPSLEVPTTDLDVPTTRVIDGVDTPPVRNPDTLPDNLGVGGRPDSVTVEVPVREPELVTVGDGPGAPQGPEAPQAPGGLGQGADDLLGSPRGPETATPQQTTPTGGGATEVPGGRGDGGDAPAHSGAPSPGDVGAPPRTGPGGSDGAGDGPGAAADGDAAPGADVPTGGSEPGDQPPGGATDPHQPGEEPGRVVIDDTGSPHVITTRDDLLLDVSFDDVIDRVLDGRGLDRARFEDLVTTPLERLSRDEVTTLLEVRRALPAVTVDTVLQKIITPGQAFETLGPDVAARLMEPEQLRRAASEDADVLESVGGFVARAADVAGLSPAELYKKLGLNYDTVTFRPDGESMFAVRYRSGGDVPLTGTFDEPVIPRQTHDAPPVPVGPLEAMADMPDSIYAIADDGARRVAIKQWIDGHHPDAAFAGSRALDLGPEGRPATVGPRNPFRGNGFGGTGADFAPELTYGIKTIEIPQGAEMWRIRPDGRQELAAVFQGDRWHPIREQTGPVR